MIEGSLSYPGLQASTIVAETNISYMSHTHVVAVQEPLSGTTIGLLMLLSTLQYQAPYMSPIYSTAALQIGQKAFVDSGGKSFQDRFLSNMEIRGKNLTHEIGITDGELGATLGTLKVIRDRQINLNGPRIYSVKTGLTADPNSASMKFNYEW